jgi:hypothetical protein
MPTPSAYDYRRDLAAAADALRNTSAGLRKDSEGLCDYSRRLRTRGVGLLEYSRALRRSPASDLSRVLKTLAETVHDKLAAGTLPRADAAKLWAGMGTGQVCAACEEPIVASQPEYELEYDDGRAAILLHGECHAAWEAERKPHGVPLA